MSARTFFILLLIVLVSLVPALGLAQDDTLKEEVLSTDGETLAQSQAKAQQAVAGSRMAVTVSAVGFNIAKGSEADRYLEASAKAGGGGYFSANNAGDLATALGAAASGQTSIGPSGDELVVGTDVVDGEAQGVADHFDSARRVAGVARYKDMPENTVAITVWERESKEINRGRRIIGGTGWISFALYTDDPKGLQSGSYRVTLTLADKVYGSRAFTIGRVTGAQPPQAAPPTWRDVLQGGADTGTAPVRLPCGSDAYPATSSVAWVADGAHLGNDNSYIAYPGSRLKGDAGTVLFRYKPAADLARLYGTRHASWTDYGKYKPPMSGFLVDTVGWMGAPTGAYAFILDPRQGGGLTFSAWDGRTWHALAWTAPGGWEWDCSQSYELGITWGAEGMGILVNGTLVAENRDVVPLNTKIPWFLGQAPWTWPYGPHSMVGTYRDVRVYHEHFSKIGKP